MGSVHVPLVHHLLERAQMEQQTPRAIAIPEIADLILEQLVMESEDWGQWPLSNFYRNTLAKLARTCKIFHEPAIKRLWRCIIPGIDPIFDISPKEAISWDVPGKIVWASEYKAAFARVQYYTRFVRKITWRDRLDKFPQISHQSIRYLYEHEYLPGLKLTAKHYKSAPQENLLGDSRRRRKGTPAPAGESPAGAGEFTAGAGKPEASSSTPQYTPREKFLGKSAVLLRDFLPARVQGSNTAVPGPHFPRGCRLAGSAEFSLLEVQDTHKMDYIHFRTIIELKSN
ncbi:hypothetical protein CC1G_12316 [Coprinopsis cinerea okayama7|uniref:Uncharacterized protein n=1 Tax=Coprinopsis cinerea (strain Okayama-7 / 130 / ATCC MYA-4618 / FGSC 9003) TaxID=240176 RepID=A8NLW2_COPC7|nr:hypothetical protein CC1G_12316 [Coprinopsis cinerea okayama7\|eukprot:XP_001834789.2 hypothetical protein CC1G_12316 [Coprinopsis cinerea okayama7\